MMFAVFNHICLYFNNFRLVPESECNIETKRSDAPNIADGGQDVLNLREVGEEMVCCPIADVTSCDVNNGFM